MHNKLKPIAAAFFAILTLVVGCKNSKPAGPGAGPVEAIWYGGHIITMEGDSAQYVESVAVRDGKIAFLGPRSEAETMKGAGTTMNDLEGKTMLPGFIDPHIHPSIAASILPLEIVSAMEWNTPEGKSIPVRDHISFMERLKDLDKSYGDSNKVLLAWGYFKPYHGDISRDELNKVSKTRPIVIWQRSCHELYLNDAALRHFKISAADFKKAPGYCDYKKGHVFEAGLFIVTKPILALLSDPTQFKKGLELMTALLHKGGLTTLCEQDFPSWI